MQSLSFRRRSRTALEFHHVEIAALNYNRGETQSHNPTRNLRTKHFLNRSVLDIESFGCESFEVLLTLPAHRQQFSILSGTERLQYKCLFIVVLSNMTSVNKIIRWTKICRRIDSLSPQICVLTSLTRLLFFGIFLLCVRY